MVDITINHNWKAVIRRYSFVTNALVAISSVAPLILPVYDYIPVWGVFTLVGILAVMGCIGSFLKQHLEDTKYDKLD